MRNKALTLALGAFIASPALAQHADLLLIKDLNGNLLTGQYDFDDGDVVNTNTRVYEGEFDEFGTSDEPGINAISSSNIPSGFAALDGNAAVGFSANAFGIDTAVSNLWYWDGTGEVNFAVSSNTLTISKAPSNIFIATLDASANDIDGFTIDTTSSDGFLHKHIDFGLSDISESSHGFYLWSLDFTVGSSTSDAVFYVHGFGLEDEIAHEAAIDWVAENLVPAPASMLAFLGLPVLMGRRRS